MIASVRSLAAACSITTRSARVLLDPTCLLAGHALLPVLALGWASGEAAETAWAVRMQPVCRVPELRMGSGLRVLGRAFVLVDQSSQYRTASDRPVVEIRSGKIRAWWLKL